MYCNHVDLIAANTLLLVVFEACALIPALLPLGGIGASAEMGVSTPVAAGCRSFVVLDRGIANDTRL
jgi:hypothetical protein